MMCPRLALSEALGAFFMARQDKSRVGGWVQASEEVWPRCARGLAVNFVVLDIISKGESKTKP